MLNKVSLGFVFAIMCVSCEPVNRYFGLEDDNFVEEVLEEGIRYETGAKLDLTPSSPE